MLDDGAPDYTTEAYNLSMKRLAYELRDMARRTRNEGPDAVRRATLLEAASRLDNVYAYKTAQERDLLARQQANEQEGT